MLYKVIQQSAVLRPTATQGIVTSESKVSVSRLGTEHFVTSSVGSSFHIYDCENLQLQYLSRPLTGTVTSAISVGELTIVGVGCDLLVFDKMVLVQKMLGHNHTVVDVVCVDEFHLISRSTSEMLVWKLPANLRYKKNHSLASEDILLPLTTVDVSKSPVSSVLPLSASFPDQVIVARTNGDSSSLQLWNFVTGELVHEFTALNNQLRAASVTSMACSTSDALIGVGLSNGTISILNIGSDATVMTLTQKEHGAVTSMAFRPSDYADGMLVAGTSKGDLVIWNLTKKSIHSYIQNAHPGGVGASMTFLSSLPLMVTSGVSDNAISVYIFDKPDGGCRLLKERRGFTVGLDFVLPYGEHDLIVAGSLENSNEGQTLHNHSSSEVGKINLIQSQQNQVWSQSALSYQTSGKNSTMPWIYRNIPKLPKLVSIGYTGASRMRHYDWPTVVSVHEGIESAAYVWSPHQQALVTRQLVIPRKASTNMKAVVTVKAVAVSPCGNYAVLGCSNGEVHRFNLQSCYHRGLVHGESAMAKISSVVSMKFLSSRDVVVAHETEIKLWKIVPRPVELGTLSCLSKYLENAKKIQSIEVFGYLCAVAVDGAVIVVDMHSNKVAREISLVDAKISAMAWSDGGKWLAIAYANKRMAIYDIPTASVVDWVQFEHTVDGIHFRKNNAQIVTVHRDMPGCVRVWQNLVLLEGKLLEPIDVNETAPVMIDSWAETEAVNNISKKRKINDDSESVESTMDESSDNLLCLSAGSYSKWQQILNLNEIKERNRPTKAAEKAKEAPFFLPVMYRGVQPVFVQSSEEDKPAVDFFNTPSTKRQKECDGMVDFVSLCAAQKSSSELSQFLIGQTPSGVHLCISQLDDEEEAMNGFIRFLAEETQKGQNADLVATWTALFLKQYANAIRGRKIFAENLSLLKQTAQSVFKHFNEQTNQLQCLIKVAAALQLHR